MSIFSTQIELRRKIIQLEEDCKDWEKQYESYKDAFYTESKLRREMIDELRFTQDRNDNLRNEIRKMQKMFDERLREAFNTHVTWQ